mgnify:CR=1 FL=1
MIVTPKRFTIDEYHRLVELQAGINHYWIVNLQVRQLECYSQPY